MPFIDEEDLFVETVEGFLKGATFTFMKGATFTFTHLFAAPASVRQINKCERGTHVAPMQKPGTEMYLAPMLAPVATMSTERRPTTVTCRLIQNRQRTLRYPRHRSIG